MDTEMPDGGARQGTRRSQTEDTEEPRRTRRSQTGDAEESDEGYGGAGRGTQRSRTGEAEEPEGRHDRLVRRSWTKDQELYKQICIYLYWIEYFIR